MPPQKPFDVNDLRFGVEFEFTDPDTASVRSASTVPRGRAAQK